MSGSEVDWAAIRSIRLSTSVAAELERLIAEGLIPDGAKFPPERELAALLGVSRTSVREGLHELDLKGLVDRRPGRGTTITKSTDVNRPSLLASLSADDRQLVEVLDFRGIIEPVIAQRAAVTATATDVLELERLVEEMSLTKTAEEAVRLDTHFHVRVASATHNSLLLRLAELGADWMKEVRLRSQATGRGRKSSLEGHREILEAIKAGLPDEALMSMQRHIDVVGLLVRK